MEAMYNSASTQRVPVLLMMATKGCREDGRNVGAEEGRGAKGTYAGVEGMPSCTQILSTVVGPGEPALLVPPGLAERNVVVVEPERALVSIFALRRNPLHHHSPFLFLLN